MPDVHRGLRFLSRIPSWISAFFLVLACVAVVLMSLSIILAVINRVIPLGLGSAGGVEFAGYMMIAVVFFGAAATLRDGAFIRVEFVFERLSGSLRSLAICVSTVAALAFMIILIDDLGEQTLVLYEQGVTSVGNLELPRYIPFALMTIGLAGLFLQSLAILVSELANWGSSSGLDQQTEHVIPEVTLPPGPDGQGRKES